MQSVRMTWIWNGQSHGQWDRSKTVQKVKKKDKAGVGTDGCIKNKISRKHKSAVFPLHAADLIGA